MLGVWAGTDTRAGGSRVGPATLRTAAGPPPGPAAVAVPGPGGANITAATSTPATPTNSPSFASFGIARPPRTADHFPSLFPRPAAGVG